MITTATVDLSQCRFPPFLHQAEGVRKIVEQPMFFLADTMGMGKTKQVIDAAQVLFNQDIVDRVLIIAPASVRTVWFDKEFGELAKHLWEHTSAQIIEYHARIRTWVWGPPSERPLRWLVTNYDYVRTHAHRDEILQFCTAKTLLVLDESSAVKNHKAKQTLSCYKIRARCGRVVLLNGTPITNNPLDMYSQGYMMNPSILGCSSYYHARAKYAIITVRGGFPKIIGWQNLDDLQQRFAPFVLRRLKEQCLDLPPKLPSVMLTATLQPATWKIYTEMRDELCVWLDQQSVSVAAQAAVKIMRLAQITSGFVGGVEAPLDSSVVRVQSVSQEKVKVIIDWLHTSLNEEPSIKLLIWTRFRAELARLNDALNVTFPHITIGQIHGQQADADRERALRLLDPRTAPKGPAVVIGITQAGSLGLNLTAAHHVIYMSNDFSHKTRMQSEDRVHRPGQSHAVSYFDVLAEGPQGQRTVDHLIQRVLRGKLDIANWTSAAWISALVEE